MSTWNEYKTMAKERGDLALECFMVVSVPVNGPEPIKASLAEHLSYQGEQEAAGTLMFAGPLSDLSGEQMDGTGMIIYQTQSFEAAQTIAENDPMHRSGARRFTIRRWLINEGSLQLNVRFSAQTVTLEKSP